MFLVEKEKMLQNEVDMAECLLVRYSGAQRAIRGIGANSKT